MFYFFNTSIRLKLILILVILLKIFSNSYHLNISMLYFIEEEVVEVKLLIRIRNWLIKIMVYVNSDKIRND